MTLEVRTALEQADLLVGYERYIEMVAPLYPEKPVLMTGMTREVERCRRAYERAAAGERVALVCSGDAGVYGMASPALELSPEYPGVSIRVLPGVTAALSSAARMGAPLGNDFCVVSLSDRLTSWETIELRLRLAARAGFVLALYNPVSKHRPEGLIRAAEILLEELPAQTLCGLAHRIGREGESTRICCLGDLSSMEADMGTTVLVGNRDTRQLCGWLVTPRGYGEKR